MPLIHVVVSTCRRERYVLNLLSTEPSDFVVRPSTRQELERYTPNRRRRPADTWEMTQRWLR